MIFNIRYSFRDNSLCFVDAISGSYHANDMGDLMESCGFSNFILDNFDGFENCIHFIESDLPSSDPL